MLVLKEGGPFAPLQLSVPKGTGALEHLEAKSRTLELCAPPQLLRQLSPVLRICHLGSDDLSPRRHCPALGVPETFRCGPGDKEISLPSPLSPSRVFNF